MNKARNTAGMLAYAEQRKRETFARANAAIDELAHAHAAINFSSVAKTAQVTKAYLYKHTVIRERIATLRSQQPNTREGLTVTRKTDKSKDMILQAKERRIHELEDEVRRLKRDLQTAYGKLYDRM